MKKLSRRHQRRFPIFAVTRKAFRRIQLPYISLTLLTGLFLLLIYSHRNQVLTPPKHDLQSPFLLFRAIGNDLPPRHQRGQSYRNLKFILENEPKYPNLQTRWLVNRLVDKDMETAIIELLRQHHQNFMVDPVDFHAYSKIPLSIQCSSKADPLHQPAAAKNYNARSAHYESMNRHRNMYIMHNNQARNTMLEEGKRSGVKYILPWDGNCFLNRRAWDDIVRGVQQIEAKVKKGATNVSDKYFSVPMARLTNNSLLLDDSYAPNANEEHQLIFRNDSTEIFDPHRRYGVMPKVDMLFRLRVPGPWDKWVKKRPKRSEDVPCETCVQSVGWVARLFSGKAKLESGPSSLSKRGFSRLEGVLSLLTRADAIAATSVYQFSNNTLLFYDENALRQRKLELHSGASPDLRAVYSRLIESADAQLTSSATMYSVVDADVGRDGDRHDYYSRILDKDSKSFEVHGDRGSDKHRILFADFARNATILTLAGYLSDNAAYSVRAAQLINNWFIGSETRMNAHFDLAAIGEHGNGTAEAFVEFADIGYVLDAVRLLVRAGTMSRDDRNKLEEWTRQLVRYIESSEVGHAGFTAKGYVGAYHDVVLASGYAFTGQTERLVGLVRQASGRVFGQFCSGKGGGLVEDVHTLNSWALLAEMGKRIGIRLQDIESTENKQHVVLLRKAAETILEERIANGEAGNVVEVLWWKYRHLYADFEEMNDFGTRNVEAADPLVGALARVAPFWNLAA